MSTHILPDADRDAMLAAADSAKATRILAKISWLQGKLIPANMPFPCERVRAESQVALMRCTPGPCVELWAVHDWTISENWRVG